MNLICSTTSHDSAVGFIYVRLYFLYDRPNYSPCKTTNLCMHVEIDFGFYFISKNVFNAWVWEY